MIYAGNVPPISFYNTDFVVLCAFLIFVGFLVYKGVPKLLGGMLDKRAEGIRSELEEAKRLREEAQEIFAGYERKLKEVEAEAEEIVASAKASAEAAAVDAKAKLAAQIDRRIAAGKDQIKSAERAVENQIRTKAASIAVETARALLAEKLTGKSAGDLINDAINDVDSRLN